MKNLSEALIEHIENLPIFENKYVELNCVNYTDEDNREGVLSLVFNARDSFSNEPVAIKFYDPVRHMDAYRLQAFDREANLLEKVTGKAKCLELVEPVSTYQLPINSNFGIVDIPTRYFVTEWIEENINDYFYNSESISVVERLKIFRSVLLAVNAIHIRNIYHRDLKVDNIRLKRSNNDSFCVVIDFGTAALVESGNIAQIEEYNNSKGAPAYSPPEALFGLSCDRNLGTVGDFFALGSLLYELFNPILFRDKCIVRYQQVYLNFTQVINHSDIESRRKEYFKVLERINTEDLFRYDYTDFRTVPKGIRHLLVNLHKEMVAFDCRKRLSSTSKVLRKLDIIIKCLRNEKKEKQLRERRQLFRDNKLRKLEYRDAKLRAYMEKQKVVASDVRS